MDALPPIVKLINAKDPKVTEAAGAAIQALLAAGAKHGSVSHRKRQMTQFVDAIKQHATEPPLGFPTLMELLQQVAKEQIANAVDGGDKQLLEDAISFGRWAHVPTSLFGAARTKFKEKEQKGDAARKLAERRKQLGLDACAATPDRSQPGSVRLASGLSDVRACLHAWSVCAGRQRLRSRTRAHTPSGLTRATGRAAATEAAPSLPVLAKRASWPVGQSNQSPPYQNQTARAPVRKVGSPQMRRLPQHRLASVSPQLGLVLRAAHGIC
jgi:hypothetical protein